MDNSDYPKVRRAAVKQGWRVRRAAQGEMFYSPNGQSLAFGTRRIHRAIPTRWTLMCGGSARTGSGGRGEDLSDMGAVYSVDIETWGGAEKTGTGLLEDLVPVLAELGARGISVGAGGIAGGPGATFLVEADARSSAESLSLAASRGVRWFMDACEKVGLDHGGIARVDLMTDSYLERHLAQEPETYAGVSEIAGLLKVSRQRVAEIRTRADFPAPVAELAAGPVWSRSSLHRFVESWERKPGRPRRKAPVSGVG